MRAKRAPRSPLTSYSILKKFAKIVVNCKIVEEVLGPFLGGFLHSIFGLHFCTLFGQIFARDLLVLRDFFDVDGGFWAFFRRVFDRTFHHDFHLRRLTGHVVVVVSACLGCMPVLWFITACWSGPDLYQGYELLLVAHFTGFLRCWFFPSRFSSRRPFATHSSVIFSVWHFINPDLLYERMVDIAPWFRSLVLVRSGWLHHRDRTSDSVDGS
jgi:hypothetical protein